MVTMIQDIDSSLQKMVVRWEGTQCVEDVNCVGVVCVDDETPSIICGSSAMSVKQS